ncbi:MAG: hypothetical protein C4304_02875 [candidate division GAL15 bacterium]
MGIAQRIPERGEALARRVGADYVTTSFQELLARPEVNCVVVATDEHLHAAPVLAAVDRGLPPAGGEALGHHPALAGSWAPRGCSPWTTPTGTWYWP